MILCSAFEITPITRSTILYLQKLTENPSAASAQALEARTLYDLFDP